jgi:hypothetical protein
MYPNTKDFSLRSAVRSTGTVCRALAAGGVLALGLAGAAHAAGTGGSYLQGAYADWEDAGDGFNLGVSVMLAPNVRAFADYTDTDIEQLRAGGGLVVPMSDLLSLEIGGSYQNLDFAGRGADDDGFGVHGIARLAATSRFTLSGKVEHVFRDRLDDEIVLGVDADVGLTEQLSVFGSYETFDELDENLLLVGGRLKF